MPWQWSFHETLRGRLLLYCRILAKSHASAVVMSNYLSTRISQTLIIEWEIPFVFFQFRFLSFPVYSRNIYRPINRVNVAECVREGREPRIFDFRLQYSHIRRVRWTLSMILDLRSTRSQDKGELSRYELHASPTKTQSSNLSTVLSLFIILGTQFCTDIRDFDICQKYTDKK